MVVKMKKIREKRGITLVALVVTIIILLILAGITITQLSKNGLLKKSIESTDKYKISDLEERVEIIKNEWIIDREEDINTTIDNLWERLIEEEIIENIADIEGPEKIDENNDRYILNTKYGYKIKINLNGVGVTLDDNVVGITLYDNGVINSNIGDISQLIYSSTYEQGIFSKQNNYLQVTKEVNTNFLYTGEDWSDLYLISSGKFDFRNYKSLHCMFTDVDLVTSTSIGSDVGHYGRSTIEFGIADSNTDFTFEKSNSILSPNEPNGVLSGNQEISVDIAGFNKKGFLKWRFATSTYSIQHSSCKIIKIWVD